MLAEEEINIINYCENITEEYKINNQQEITRDNMEMLSISQSEDKFITNIKIKEDFLIFLSTKTSKNLIEINSTNEKNIKIIGFEITIIKLNLKNGNDANEKIEININIPLKEPKIVAYKTICNQKYIFYDFIKINEIKNYLHIYTFDQLHIYKIYLKDNQLKYNKIELKKFSEKTKVLYLGEYFKVSENLLEIALLLKPMNNFIFLQIDTEEKCTKITEKKYEFKNAKYKNLLYKFIRSYCGMFLFSEKETNKKYIIYKKEKDENTDEILLKEVQIDLLDSNTKENYFYYLYNISNKLYFISELPQEKNEENNYNYITLGIFYLTFNDQNDKYNSQMIQKIKIKNEGRIKDYNITINTLKYISIQMNEKLLFIHLDQNSSVDMVNKFSLNLKNLQILTNVFDKSSEWSISLSYIKDKFYLSKFLEDKENCSNGKCILDYKPSKNKNISKPLEEKVDQFIQKENENLDVNEIIEKVLNKNGQKDKISTDEQSPGKPSNEIEVKIEGYIDNIIKKRIEMNNEKIEMLKKDYEKRYEMIREDILSQEKDNENLENEVKELLIRISKLEKIKDNNGEDEKEKEGESNKNLNYKNVPNKTDFLSYLQYNSLRQFNQMKMMNQFNMMNMEGFYNQFPFNESMYKQFFQYNKKMMNQGNFNFKNKINTNNK